MRVPGLRVESMRKTALILACCLTGHALLAGGVVVETSLFQDGALPEGWRTSANGLVSPTYSNRVTQVALSYAATDPGTMGTLTLYASNSLPPAEHEIATLNTRTMRAQLDFPEETGYRSFRVVTNGVSLASFAATWLDTRLATPTNVAAANNTGSSFDLSWAAVENATGYHIAVWTNATVGASAGTTNWIETFAHMKTSTGTAAFGNNKDTKESRADHPEEWTEFDEVYLSKNEGHIRLGKQATIGCLTVPSHEIGENSFLRVVAARYDGNDKGQNLAIDFISPDGTQTNRHIHVLTVEDHAYYQPLAELPEGWKIALTVAVPDNGSDFRVDLESVAYIDGYDPGTEERDVFRTVNLDGDTTCVSISDLPPVAVQVSVQALAENVADVSEASAAIMVDLAHPPPVPQLAVLGSVVADVGYTENFDALIGLGTSADWTDGLTLPYWQARKVSSPVNSISEKSSMANQSVGLYAYHGTNKNDTASYSLAIVSKTNNRMTFGFAVTNDTNVLLTNFQLSFTARQWTFTSSRTVPQSLHLECLVTNEVVAVSDAGDWIAVDALQFDAVASLQEAEANGRADYAAGSAFANLTATLTGQRLHPGEVLMLRWSSDPVANGEALGVDDISLSCSTTSLGTTMRFVKTARGDF